MNSAAWKQVALLLVLALAARLIVARAWQSRLDKLDTRFGFPDSESYWVLGQAIAQGRPYEFGPDSAKVFRSPGYPLLLAAVFCFAGEQPSVMWARAENALLGALTVGGVWWLARELFDARAGLVAGAMAAFYPGAIATSVLVLSEAPFGLLMLVQLALWAASWKADSVRRAAFLAVWAGLVAGAATLVRPSWLLFTPLAVVAGLLVGGRHQCVGLRADSGSPSPRPSTCGRGRRAWIGVGMLAGLIVAMMPWWVRNARLTGRFVPTTLQVGASLYDGLNPEATGASNMDLVPEAVKDLRRRAAAEGETGAALEVRLDRQFRTEALTWSRSDPARVARLAAVKLVRMWNIWPNEASLSSWPIRLAVLLTYVPILLLGMIGAARTIRWGWPYILCWLPAVYFTMLHMVFVGSIRYRQPAMLGLIVLAAGAVGSWRTSRTGKQGAAAEQLEATGLGGRG